MRPRGTVLGIQNRQQKAQEPRPEFAENAPPLCQACWTKRHRAGSFISRLVFRPGVLLKCLDCGVTVFDDRPVALDDHATEKAVAIISAALPIVAVSPRRLRGGA